MTTSPSLHSGQHAAHASGTLVITGATGALGVPLLAALLREELFSRVIALTRGEPAVLRRVLEREAPGIDLATLECVQGELGRGNGTAALTAATRHVDCLIHAAACTQFRAPGAQLAATNVEGTREVLTWAASLAQPPRVVHLSTTCIAGDRTGEIREQPLTAEPAFVNEYQRTKWQAEQLVTASPLRPEIVRLATIVGSAADGHVERSGAFHTTLRWLYGGLLPMIPGNSSTRLDLLPTEVVTDFVLRLLASPPRRGAVYHVSNGAGGVLLSELLPFAALRFAERSSPWQRGQIVPPVLAARAAFDDFRATVVKSRDFLFSQVLESVDSFLPELFYPKQFATTRAESVWGGPLPLSPWHKWMGQVIDYALDTDFGRKDLSLVPA
jgi:nucleoside-diphosphate-sugar epimerase